MEVTNTIKHHLTRTKFSNDRTFLALIRTCAVFVGLAIFLKNKYVFLIVVAIMLFGLLEYMIINKKLKEENINKNVPTYNHLVTVYAGLFILIFIILFFKPPF